MLMTLALFLGAAVAIYLACEYFVNGIEWFGRKLKLGATATVSYTHLTLPTKRIV